MNKTPNYNLSQWAKSDRVLMDDFNADNAKIDAALKAHTDALAAVPRFVCGSYDGDNAATKEINLGFRPKAVYLATADGRTTYVYRDTFILGGFFFEGHPLTFPGNGLVMAEITSTGFRVKDTGNATSDVFHVMLNAAGYTYHYIVMR